MDVLLTLAVVAVLLAGRYVWQRPFLRELIGALALCYCAWWVVTLAAGLVGQ